MQALHSSGATTLDAYIAASGWLYKRTERSLQGSGLLVTGYRLLPSCWVLVHSAAISGRAVWDTNRTQDGKKAALGLGALHPPLAEKCKGVEQ